MCCAEVLGAALYKAEIYDLSTVNSTYQTASAPGLGNILNSQGWILIEDEDDLQPGDVLFYEKLVEPGTAGLVYLDGEEIHTCHVDIYYGDGTKVNTGGGFGQVFHDFNVDTTCYSVAARWRFAFRYPGD